MFLQATLPASNSWFIVYRYYHRSLKVPKLVDVKFTYIPRNSTLARLSRLHKLPSTPTLAGKGLREMQESDLPQVLDLYNRYKERFTMVPLLTMQELKHQFLSGLGRGDPIPSGWGGRREGQVVWAYVVEVVFKIFLLRLIYTMNR